jgi:hypothetical protein
LIADKSFDRAATLANLPHESDSRTCRISPRSVELSGVPVPSIKTSP